MLLLLLKFLLLLLLLQQQVPLRSHVVQVLGHVRLPDVAVLQRLQDPVGDVLLLVVVGESLCELGVLCGFDCPGLLLLLLFRLLLMMLRSRGVKPLRHRPLLLHHSLQVVQELAWRSFFHLDRVAKF